MKNKKYIVIISALLMILMALTACQDGKVPETPADAPVTVEAKFDNFIKTVAKENNPLNKVALISDAYGEMCDWEYDLGLAILYKESKDKLNNLTETYTIYSVADGTVLCQIMNTYPDEYGRTDDFGNTTYPEKSISDVYFDWTYAYNDVYYVVVEWEIRTPIDEEIIEDEDLDTSYTVDTYYDFYDITGKFIATSSVVDDGDYKDGNESISLVSFGKTVGVFDKDGKLVAHYGLKAGTGFELLPKGRFPGEHPRFFKVNSSGGKQKDGTVKPHAVTLDFYELADGELRNITKR